MTHNLPQGMPHNLPSSLFSNAVPESFPLLFISPPVQIGQQPLPRPRCSCRSARAAGPVPGPSSPAHSPVAETPGSAPPSPSPRARPPPAAAPVWPPPRAATATAARRTLVLPWSRGREGGPTKRCGPTEDGGQRVRHGGEDAGRGSTCSAKGGEGRDPAPRVRARGGQQEVLRRKREDGTSSGHETRRRGGCKKMKKQHQWEDNFHRRNYRKWIRKGLVPLNYSLVSGVQHTTGVRGSSEHHSTPVLYKLDIMLIARATEQCTTPAWYMLWTTRALYARGNLPPLPF